MIDNNLFGIAFLAAILLIGAVTIGLILARLYQRASKDRAFVRTGLGGQKVVMDGGAVCLPVFHELIWVNMNTLKLEVHRSGADSLFTKDRMRVDVIVAFFVRCIPTVEGDEFVFDQLLQRFWIECARAQGLSCVGDAHPQPAARLAVIRLGNGCRSAA